jgi:hypothetical protein
MGTTLLNLVNSFKNLPYRVFPWKKYETCTECRCGVFQFDDFRALPENIINALGLQEIQDFDDERQRTIWAYSPEFNA